MSINSKPKDHSRKPRILIIGGVAGGASCAARARRLSENAEIIMFERGPYVSFANCGLPYFVGDVITSENSLLVATPELFKKDSISKSGHRAKCLRSTGKNARYRSGIS